MNPAAIFHWLSARGYTVEAVEPSRSDPEWIEVSFRPTIDGPAAVISLPIERASGPEFGALYDMAIGAPEAE